MPKESSAITFGRSLALVSSLALMNGGVYSFVYSWQTIPLLLSPSIFHPFNWIGFISLISSLLIIAVEINHEKITSNILVPKIVMYTLLGTVAFFNLTTVPAAYCLLPTAFVLSFGITIQATQAAQLPITRHK
jgi:hypothetical protein